MTTSTVASTISGDPMITANIDWWNSDLECRIVISHPLLDPLLWERYLCGADTSYRRHGVEHALDPEALAAGDGTALFFAVVTDDDRVVGGLRAKGPLLSIDDAHATVEWAGQPGEARVRKMIADRLPFGVLEMKTAWVEADRGRGRAITTVLARSAAHSMSIVGNHFCMASCAEHILAQWRTSGGTVCDDIPATPYPDERYRTQIMWWDRSDWARHAEPLQVQHIHRERRDVERALDDRSPARRAAAW